MRSAGSFHHYHHPEHMVLLRGMMATLRWEMETGRRDLDQLIKAGGSGVCCGPPSAVLFAFHPANNSNGLSEKTIATALHPYSTLILKMLSSLYCVDYLFCHCHWYKNGDCVKIYTFNISEREKKVIFCSKSAPGCLAF